MTTELPNQAAALYAKFNNRDLLCGSGRPDNLREKMRPEASSCHDRARARLGIEGFSVEEELDAGFRGFVAIDRLWARICCDRRIEQARRELLRPSWRLASVPSMMMTDEAVAP